MSAVYTSNSVPFGGFTVKVYRTQTNPVLLGEYILESSSPADASVMGDRPGADGGDNGWWLVNGKTEGAATLQLATSATPTLKNGDFFKCSKFSVDTNGNGEARYFVIHNPSPAIGTTEYRKQGCTIREDKFPDATVQAIAEAA